MFGQTGNSSFGFNAANQNNTPFGQSAFGKSIPTTFGTSAQTVFGTNTSLFSSKPTSSVTGSLFGNNTTNSTFGASTASQPSFGGFGNMNSSAPMFGPQQNSSANLFGSNNASTAFGQISKASNFGFNPSAGTNVFGQTQQNTAQVAPFGQSTSSANTGLFASASGFCANASGNISGTVVKFSPVTGTDTMVKNGVTQTISTRHHCITCMKEYESKSLEELRLEDYNAGRKGSNQVQSSTIFGAGTQNSPFGTLVPNNSSANTGFGAATGGFTNTNQSSNSSLFSKSVSGFSGVPTTTSSSFTFNSTGSSNIFNPQSKPFGNTSSTPLFSSNTVGQSVASTFGNVNTQNNAFGTGFTSGQPNQSIGLFSQSKPAFSIPSSTSSTSFGFGQSSTTNTCSLFGSKTIASNFGSTFGGTNVSTFTAGTTGYGAGQNSNSSLFHNSYKPTGQSTNFAFGSSGNPLFNTTKPNLFGNNGAGSSFNTPGAFGSIPVFGSTANAISVFGSNTCGSGMHINNTEQGSNTVPVHQQILALVSTPFGDSPLLKNLLPASGKSEEFLKPSNNVSKNVNNLQFKILAGSKTTKLKPQVITSAPLLKKSLFEGLEEEDPISEAFQPRSNAKRLVLRPKSQDYSYNLVELNKKIAKCEKSSDPIIELIPDISYKENDILYSWLKVTIPQKSIHGLKSTHGQYIDDARLRPPSASSEILSTIEALDNTVAELRPSLTSINQFKLKNRNSNNDLNKLNDSTNKNDVMNDNSESLILPENEDLRLEQPITTNTSNVVLQRYGYFTIPSISVLDKYVVDKTCIVPNFTVGRKGYGNVYFSDSFDVYGLNLDEIVHFRHKEIIVYPDDQTKPPVGEGLNRKAQVTLDRVWPEDKSTHDFITDPKRLIEMDYEAKLRRVSAKHETRFLEYRPETGSWVFKVDHFSKYGLCDSDDEDNDRDINEKLKKHKNYSVLELTKCLESPKHIFGNNDSVSIDSATENWADTTFNNPFNSSLDDMMYNKQSSCSTTAVHAHLNGTKSRTLQLMKATFFNFAGNDLTNQISINKNNQKILDINPDKKDKTFEEPACDTDNYKKLKNIAFEIKPLLKSEHLKSSDNEIRATDIRKLPDLYPKVAVLRFKSGILSNKLLMNKHRSKYMADMGIQMGKTFRPTWGPRLTLLSLYSQPCLASCDDDNFNTFTHSVQLLEVNGNSVLKQNFLDILKASIEGHLMIQLQCSNIVIFQDWPMLMTPDAESCMTALNLHETHSSNVACNTELDTLKYACSVWRLCGSLWGKLVDFSTTYSKESHDHIILRKEALGKWLKLVSAEAIESEIVSMDSKHKIILSLLTANKLDDACEIALKTGDHCLALLLSQLSGMLTVKQLAKQQIELWNYTYADGNLSNDHIKLFLLIAGIPVISKPKNTINVCENLDWKRVFALHLWYFSLPTASISDVVDLYEKSFMLCGKNYSSYPEPEYFKNNFTAETRNGIPIYDLCFHLIKLYCGGIYPLEGLLNPQTYTYDPLDYSLSWFLYQTLYSLGYSHSSRNVSILINNYFASQLENIGLWHWAIFVLLHISDLRIRQKSVSELLLRNVQIDQSPDYLKREKFIEMQLKVPTKWINYAKAIKASSMNRQEDAASYFIHAQEWNKAHDIIMKYLATDAIINDDYSYVKSLLQLLISSCDSNTISGWTNQGQLIWDYIIVTTQVKSLIREKKSREIEYYLESFQPQLTTFCTKISLFPCPTITHRLCQAEMAKRTLHLIRSLILLHSNGANHSNFLIYLFSQLPLPEDYAQQELRPTVNICVNNMNSSCINL